MRNGCEKRLGVFAGRGVEYFFGVAIFDDFTFVHDGYVIRHVVNNGEVVGNEDHGEFHFSDELLEEIEDLGLDGDIQRGDGLVCDDEVWFRGECAGDGDSLALSAGELMWVLAAEAGIQSDSFHEGVDGVLQGGFTQFRMAARECFCQCAENRIARVQRGVGILEDHLKVKSALPDLPGGERREVAAVERDAA